MLSVVHIFSGDLWAGAEVMVFNLLSEFKKTSNLKIIAIALNEGVLTDSLKAAGVETYIIPEARHSLPVIARKIFKILNGKRIDVVHSHRYKEDLLALFVAKLKGVKYLTTTIHGLPESLPNQVNRPRSPSMMTRLNIFILKHYFTSVVAVSREIKEILVKKYDFKESKVKVINNGIPISAITQTERSPGLNFHVGSVGRMVPVKDYELFLEIAAIIKKTVNNVHFSVLGGGPLLEQLIQKSIALNLEDCVEFKSPLTDPAPYYQSLDIYLNTSIHEGIPLSILEAMAHKIPVVAPSVGGIPEIIQNGENGLLVNDRRPSEFANACINLLLNNQLRALIIKNAFETIEVKFNCPIMANSYMTLYESS